MICPEGTGIDCHRIYESMFLDAIPILKTSNLNTFYKNLPVICVTDWDEITEEFLNANFNFYNKRLIDWKIAHPLWFTAAFWIN